MRVITCKIKTIYMYTQEYLHHKERKSSNCTITTGQFGKIVIIIISSGFGFTTTSTKENLNKIMEELSSLTFTQSCKCTIILLYTLSKRQTKVLEICKVMYM